jgi:SAM-dependent methyltransferase
VSTIEPHFGHLATQAVLAALRLGLFRRLANGPAAAAALANAVQADRRAVTMLLDALVGCGQLQREGEHYQLPPMLHQMLECPGVETDRFFDAFRQHLELLVRDWSRLTEVVRSGQPVSALGTAGEGEGPEVFKILVYRLFPRNYLLSQRIVEQLDERVRGRHLDVLDLGAGSAAWSIPFAEAQRDTAVVALDFEPVLEVARHFARACGVEDQYTFRAADLRQADLGQEAFDVALVGHICHSEGESGSRRLFQNVHAALRPGGLMLVADMFPDDERLGHDGGAHALLFALNMLVHTENGGTFTIPEYRAWAREAGFQTRSLIELPGPAPILAFEK